MNLNENDLAILFVGSGFRRKGLALLIKALAQKNRDCPKIYGAKRVGAPATAGRGLSLESEATRQSRIKLFVAGKGRCDYYTRLADSLGLQEKVKFLGLVKDIDSLYASADILVLPSLYEPFSNTCLEAMACGVPMLTTRCNGVSEILGGDLKELIIEHPFNTEEIASKISFLASKDIRRSLSPKLCELSQKFSLSRHLDEVLKLYQKVLKK